MPDQKDVFRSSEADAWFARNRAGKPAPERSADAALLQQAGATPRRVLEIGCSDGQLLAALCAELGCDGAGIDPSGEAIARGRERFPHLHLELGTAERLPFDDGSFDAVVFGFCLYLCDRPDLFRIAAEADRVLADPGWLVVTDFLPPFPYRNRYSHLEGVHSYKMDYSRLFSWNPAYVERLRHVHGHAAADAADSPDSRMGSVLLRKDSTGAWPLEPFR